MISIFKSHPKPRYIYAIVKGKYLGEFFVHIEQKKDTHCFLSLPDLIIREVTDDKFKYGLDKNIIEKLSRLPNDVFEVCKQQYFKNKQAALNTNTTK